MTEQHECEWAFSIYFPHVSCKCGETMSTKEANARLSEYEEQTKEKDRRIYYQSIVYDVCNLLDSLDGKRAGTGIVCGTLDEPSREVQKNIDGKFREYSKLKDYAILLDRWFDSGGWPIKATRAIGAARAKCADILEAQ